jgi:hypothetical protein
MAASGIAKLANVGRAAVSNWRRRHADFPAPVGGTATNPRFNARDVEDWLRRQGKLHEASTAVWAWRQIESFQPASHIGDVVCLAGAYLLARSLAPAAGGRLLTPRQVVSRLRGLDKGLAAHLGGLLPDRWEPDLAAVLELVDQLAGDDGPEAAFEHLHGQYVTSAQSMSGLAGTPDPVAELMLAIAGAGHRILDFTCGTGSILRMAADQATRAGTTTECYAQEVKPHYALIALLRLWFVHHRALLAGLKPAPPVVHIGDSLLADAYPELCADVVVANFPFGIHDWGREKLTYDPRWTYGLPPRTEPELAWIQHGLAHLSPGGTCVVLMPPSAAARPAGRRIRAELVRRGTLRAVIALPAGLMQPAGVGLHVWILTRPDDDQPASDRVLFVNAAAWPAPLAPPIAKAWHDHQTGSVPTTAGTIRVVPAIELLDTHIDLTPHRNLTPSDDTAPDPARTIARLDEFDAMLATLRENLPRIAAATTALSDDVPQASLSDLIKSGSMTILRPSTRNRPEAQLQVQPGDILIPTASRDSPAEVATDTHTGAELEPGLQILRVDPAQFDSWFVAGALSKTLNQQTSGQATRASGSTPRIDIRRLTIPVIALAGQQQHGQALRKLAEFRTSLEHTAAAGAALTQEISDGLASGAFTVQPDNATTQAPLY